MKTYRHYQHVNIEKLLYKPTSECVAYSIYGMSFFGGKTSPKVYAILTQDRIRESDISFRHNDLLYKLDDVIIHKCEGMVAGEMKTIFLIECRSWSEEVIIDTKNIS